jgi:hypothetical protein
MLRIARILKSLSLAKGKIFTCIGFGIMGLAGYIMYEARDVTETSIELLITGFILSGVNNETIDHIRNRKPTDDPEP